MRRGLKEGRTNLKAQKQQTKGENFASRIAQLYTRLCFVQKRRGEKTDGGARRIPVARTTDDAWERMENTGFFGFFFYIYNSIPQGVLCTYRSARSMSVIVRLEMNDEIYENDVNVARRITENGALLSRHT